MYIFKLMPVKEYLKIKFLHLLLIVIFITF